MEQKKKKERLNRKLLVQIGHLYVLVRQTEDKFQLGLASHADLQAYSENRKLLNHLYQSFK